MKIKIKKYELEVEAEGTVEDCLQLLKQLDVQNIELPGIPGTPIVPLPHPVQPSPPDWYRYPTTTWPHYRPFEVWCSEKASVEGALEAAQRQGYTLCVNLG